MDGLQMKSILAGYFRLDGGAMFGVVPRPLWETRNPPDEKNRCTWALRCLYIEVEGRRILIDTGLGTKQSPEFFRHYVPEGDPIHVALPRAGIPLTAITDVILTHLHFDHCGGAIVRNEEGELAPTFPNARYWVSLPHWMWAIDPNPRERASFLRENFAPLLDWGLISWAHDGQEIAPGVTVQFCYGHTEAMLIVRIALGGRRELLYLADLIPSSYHVPMPYIMAYDVRPLQTLKEKAEILQEAIAHQHILFFEHDPHVECAIVVPGKRYPQVSETFSLSEIDRYL